MNIILNVIQIFCSTLSHDNNKFKNEVELLVYLEDRLYIFEHMLKEIEEEYWAKNKQDLYKNFDVHQKVFSELNYLQHEVKEGLVLLAKGSLKDIYRKLMKTSTKTIKYHLPEVCAAEKKFYESCRRKFIEMGVNYN